GSGVNPAAALVLPLALDAALGRRVGAQPLVADVAAAVRADSVRSRRDALARGHDIAHVLYVLAPDRVVGAGGDVGQRLVQTIGRAPGERLLGAFVARALGDAADFLDFARPALVHLACELLDLGAGQLAHGSSFPLLRSNVNAPPPARV